MYICDGHSSVSLRSEKEGCTLFRCFAAISCKLAVNVRCGGIEHRRQDMKKNVWPDRLFEKTVGLFLSEIERKVLTLVIENSDPASLKNTKLSEEKAKIEAEIDKALSEREELDHRIRRIENRMDYLKKGERKQRTHRLCVKGGVIESIVPGLTDFSEKEFYDLMETVFSMPLVESLIQSQIDQHLQRKESENG